MASLHQLFIVGRIFAGLLAGRDGEEVVAAVRDCAVTDPAPILKRATFAVVLAIVALGCFEAVGSANAPMLADVAAIRSGVDL